IQLPASARALVPKAEWQGTRRPGGESRRSGTRVSAPKRTDSPTRPTRGPDTTLSNGFFAFPARDRREKPPPHPSHRLSLGAEDAVDWFAAVIGLDGTDDSLGAGTDKTGLQRPCDRDGIHV